MRMPTWIKVICRADGRPLKGELVTLTIKVRRKNDFNVPGGPTDDSGTAVMTLPEVEEWADLARGTFPMDYTGLGDFNGELVVSAESRDSLDRALRAYEMFHRGIDYPAGYAEKLRGAKKAVEQIAPAILTVEVDHDGEGVTVRTLEVPA